MRFDDIESMILFRIYDLIHSRLNVLVEFCDDEKETLYMFIIVVSFSLIFDLVNFSFSVANNSCFVDNFKLEFLDSFQHHRIFFAIDVLIDETNEIFQKSKIKIFRRESEIHD